MILSLLKQNSLEIGFCRPRSDLPELPKLLIPIDDLGCSQVHDTFYNKEFNLSKICMIIYIYI